MKNIVKISLRTMIVAMIVSGYVYIAFTSQIQSKEATMVLGAWADMIKENKELKSELEFERMGNDNCQRWRVEQSMALGLWRSGYLTTRCEDIKDRNLDFELGAAEQMITDPWNFEEEFEIINSLKQRDFFNDQCINDLNETMGELQTIYLELQKELGSEDFEVLYDKVDEALRIKNNSEKK